MNISQLKHNLNEMKTPMKPLLKQRRNNGQRYIYINAPCTLYNIQGQANPTSARPIQFNQDGTIDFGPFHPGYTVKEVNGVVELSTPVKLFSGTYWQRAVMPVEVLEVVMELVEKEGLGWSF